jgi:hypothetical protein
VKTALKSLRFQSAWGICVSISLTLVFCGATGCGRKVPLNARAITGPARSQPESLAEVEEHIRRFCGDCHAVPQPESFPRDRWAEEVRIGYQQYVRSGRDDLTPPPIAEVVAYYRKRAPDKLVFHLPQDSAQKLPLSFRREDVDWEERPRVAPAVSGLAYHKLPGSDQPWLVISDMATGTITALNIRSRQSRVLARLQFPCRIEPCDLEGNGRVGFVVAELGSFFAMDHHDGKVIWLRPEEIGVEFRVIPLAEGLGRVADVRVADFDCDGDPDVLVAEFGHYRTGGILLLENETTKEGQLRFVPHRLDHRPGTIHIPVTDLNADGRPDFVALISNEWEAVEWFVNLGNNRFLCRPLWRGPDLTFGSSGLELVDLDGDGDTDILFTNGDSFDNLYANPSHGVQWLENRNPESPEGFHYHRLLDWPGAYRAMTGDLDGDGDLDIVASAWLPKSVRPQELQRMEIPSLIILEQKPGPTFSCHLIDRSWPQFPILLLADLDEDGDLDIVAGRHSGLDGGASDVAAPLCVYWNEMKSVAGSARQR